MTKQAQNKTQATKASATAFIKSIENDERRRDSHMLHEMMSDISNEPAKMWGTSIVGYGTYHYKYPSGREGDTMIIGFSPRKAALTIYFLDGFEKYTTLLSQLGAYKTGKSCLYIKRLSDVNRETLRQLLAASYASAHGKQPAVS